MYSGEDGRRCRKYFTNETDALAFAKKKEAELGINGSSFGTINDDERAALTFWRSFTTTATPTPPDLLAVLRDYQREWMASKASRTVSAAVEAYLDHQEASKASDRHTATLRSRLGRFAADHGDAIASTISTSIFTDWLNSLRSNRADNEGSKLSLVTRHNLTRSLRAFFAFAVENGWSLSNPIPAAKRSKSKAAKIAIKSAPAIMHPSDISRFMGALLDQQAACVKAPSLVPFWSLKFFAGIRDSEAASLDWSMIDLDGGQIHLPARLSKTGEQRTIKIRPNLADWIRPFAKASGPVAPGPNTRKRRYKQALDALAERDDKGKITKPFNFPSNAARHCFGTFHLYHFRDAGETSLQLGHKGNPAMLHEHYKNPTAEKHAAAFWEIRPPSKAPASKITDIKTGRKSA